MCDRQHMWWSEAKLIMWEYEEYLKCTIKLTGMNFCQLIPVHCRHHVWNKKAARWMICWWMKKWNGVWMTCKSGRASSSKVSVWSRVVHGSLFHGPDPTRPAEKLTRPDPTRDCRQKVWPDPTRPAARPAARPFPNMYNLKLNNYIH